VGARVDGLGGTTTTVRCFEDNALAKFVLDGGGKGYVRRSTAAAPATPLMVDLTARIADVPAGGVFCSDDDILRGVTWGEAQPSPCALCVPQPATKAHTVLPHAYESRDACAWVRSTLCLRNETSNLGPNWAQRVQCAIT
jgi:hypothetical protein